MKFTKCIFVFLVLLFLTYAHFAFSQEIKTISSIKLADKPKEVLGEEFFIMPSVELIREKITLMYKGYTNSDIESKARKIYGELSAILQQGNFKIIDTQQMPLHVDKPLRFKNNLELSVARENSSGENLGNLSVKISEYMGDVNVKGLAPIGSGYLIEVFGNPQVAIDVTYYFKNDADLTNVIPVFDEYGVVFVGEPEVFHRTIPMTAYVLNRQLRELKWRIPPVYRQRGPNDPQPSREQSVVVVKRTSPNDPQQQQSQNVQRFGPNDSLQSQNVPRTGPNETQSSKSLPMVGKDKMPGSVQNVDRPQIAPNLSGTEKAGCPEGTSWDISKKRCECPSIYPQGSSVYIEGKGCIPMRNACNSMAVYNSDQDNCFLCPPCSSKWTRGGVDECRCLDAGGMSTSIDADPSKGEVCPCSCPSNSALVNKKTCTPCPPNSTRDYNSPGLCKCSNGVSIQPTETCPNQKPVSKTCPKGQVFYIDECYYEVGYESCVYVSDVQTGKNITSDYCPIGRNWKVSKTIYDKAEGRKIEQTCPSTHPYFYQSYLDNDDHGCCLTVQNPAVKYKILKDTTFGVDFCCPENLNFNVLDIGNGIKICDDL